MNYTARQISTVSGVSVQAVHKHIHKQGIKPVITKGNTFYYSFDDAVKVINLIKPDKQVVEIDNRLQLVKNEVDDNTQISTAVIDVLQQQLEAKDQQIADLLQRLGEAQAINAKYAGLISSVNDPTTARSEDDTVAQDPEQVKPESNQTTGKRSFGQRLRDAVSAFKK